MEGHRHSQVLPWLGSKAVPGQLKDLEAQPQQDGVFITQSSHQQSEEESLSTERKEKHSFCPYERVMIVSNS